ncbi:hypothetical protein CDAR_71881 [Caerostris darwini]|uniref:Uncharacterized protein n=1 Tax=Caerostris darwini TaxID=1538125 RepID=A0AAV4TKZ1_9ARAC|nr:hypothetical protein CDAR_71881 [Caerostris darwini]
MGSLIFVSRYGNEKQFSTKSHKSPNDHRSKNRVSSSYTICHGLHLLRGASRHVKTPSPLRREILLLTLRKRPLARGNELNRNDLRFRQMLGRNRALFWLACSSLPGEASLCR